MIAANQIQTLAGLEEPVISLFLNTENPNPSRHPRVPANINWLDKNRAALEESLTVHEAKAVEKVFARVDQFLKDRHPQEKALAIFAGQSTWTVIPLQAVVQNAIHWGKPALGQLVRLLGEHSRYGVVAIDRNTARFFEFYLGEFTSLSEKQFEVDESQWKRTDVGHIATETMRKGHGPDRDLYDHRLDAQYERLWQDIAARAASLVKQHGFAGIFLVGPERPVSSIHKHLAADAAGIHVVNVFEDLGQFAPKDIRRRIEPLIADYENTARLAEVRKLLAAEGGSVLDPDEALAKLQAGTIGTLFVAETHELHFRECVACLTVSREGGSVCAQCGGQRIDAAMTETLARIALARGTALFFVTGEAAELLAKAGGMAGRLRQNKRTARA
jgi:peptide subunit release factor 1 (eRF1)